MYSPGVLVDGLVSYFLLISWFFFFRALQSLLCRAFIPFVYTRVFIFARVFFLGAQ